MYRATIQLRVGVLADIHIAPLTVRLTWQHGTPRLASVRAARSGRAAEPPLGPCVRASDLWFPYVRHVWYLDLGS